MFLPCKGKLASLTIQVCDTLDFMEGIFSRLIFPLWFHITMSGPHFLICWKWISSPTYGWLQMALLSQRVVQLSKHHGVGSVWSMRSNREEKHLMMIHLIWLKVITSIKHLQAKGWFPEPPNNTAWFKCFAILRFNW